MTYKIAVVEWNDAWFSENLSTDVNCLRKTVGWLIQNNKRVVRLALTQDADGVQDLMNIPRAYVRSLRIIDPRQLRDAVEGDEDQPEAEAG